MLDRTASLLTGVPVWTVVGAGIHGFVIALACFSVYQMAAAPSGTTAALAFAALFVVTTAVVYLVLRPGGLATPRAKKLTAYVVFALVIEAVAVGVTVVALDSVATGIATGASFVAFLAHSVATVASLYAVYDCRGSDAGGRPTPSRRMP